MKIAHIGNTAGVASIISRGQSAQGHKTEVYVFDEGTQQLFGGKLVRWNDSEVEQVYFLHELVNFDVWHYHYPYTGLKEILQGRKGRHHKYLKHYHGDDLRGKYESDFCLVSTPDLLPYAQNGIWLPNPLDLEFYSRFKRTKENDIPVVIFYPAHMLQPSVQDNHTKVLERLQQEGKCRVITTLKFTYEELMREMANADIVIGKIRLDMGWFGKFELEGMALGKPVITYVSDELFNRYKPPIYRTTKETFEEDLESLIDEKNEQEHLSRAGIEYIGHNHDMVKIVAKLEEYYRMA